MISLGKKYFLKNRVVKPSGVHDLGRRFDRLSRETQVDLIYYCLNVKKMSS